ncbi:hypothetical protein KA005_72620, partial [bacterium]|nr:hypothetical protein [bacterium]
SKYSELTDDISDAFDDYEIDIEEIEEATEEELEQLFQRLQLGTPLNTAEKLNAITSNLRDFCHNAAAKSFFKNKISLKNTRYVHFEIITKWAFVESRGIQPQMRFPVLEEFFKDNRSFSTESVTAKRIIGALEFLNAAFPEKCPYVRNRANALSICMLAGRVFEQKLARNDTAQDFGKFVKRFFTDLSAEVEKGVNAVDQELLRYQQAITSGSTGGNSIKARINILAKRLATFSSQFSSLLGAYYEVADEAARNIEELASPAKELIHNVNRKYAATAGEDLFKMTTETSAGLLAISVPCRDIGQYGKFVDMLYFLIYEGSGSCKRLPSPVPQFAMDVKSLRTALRHDLDHGKDKEIRKKRIKNAKIFEKYSGKKTPEECGPEDFLIAQLRILKEMVAFLGCLR